QTVTIEECLDVDSKNFQEGGRCEDCVDEVDDDREQRNNAITSPSQSAPLKDLLDHRADRINSTRTYKWKKFTRLPEVLLISLTRVVRVGGQDSQKADVEVTFGKTLDMKPYIETKRPPKGSTRYRLMGIINH